MPITTAGGVADSTTTYIEAAKETAATAITALQTAAQDWTATNWNDIATPATGTYTKFTEADNAIAAALAAYDTAIAAIPAPAALPTAPALAGYTAPIWSDTFWTDLKGILTVFTADITSSDDVDSVVTKLTGETTKLQVALYAADRERKQQGLRDSFSAASSLTGSKGFTHPNSMTTALCLVAQQSFRFDLSQVSRDLIKHVFDWAKSNYQFTIEKQIAAHSADTEFNTRYADTLVRVYDSELKGILYGYREQVEIELSKAGQKIKNYALRLEAIKTNADIDNAEDRINAANFGTEVQQHDASVTKAVQTAAENARNKISAAVTAVNAAAQMMASANQISIGVLNG